MPVVRIGEKAFERVKSAPGNNFKEKATNLILGNTKKFDERIREIAVEVVDERIEQAKRR